MIVKLQSSRRFVSSSSVGAELCCGVGGVARPRKYILFIRHTESQYWDCSSALYKQQVIYVPTIYRVFQKILLYLIILVATDLD